jgi:hypothetical protein
MRQAERGGIRFMIPDGATNVMASDAWVSVPGTTNGAMRLEDYRREHPDGNRFDTFTEALNAPVVITGSASDDLDRLAPVRLRSDRWFQSWPMHNLVGHPVSELLHLCRLADLGDRLHDATLPTHTPGTGRG